MSVEDILKERRETHGDWAKQAQVAEELQAILLDGKLYTASQAQALKMIATKLSRIVTGDDAEPDHWRDIAGYATLAAKQLEGGVLSGDVTHEQARKAKAAQDRAAMEQTDKFLMAGNMAPFRRNHCPRCGVEEGYVHKKDCPLLLEIMALDANKEPSVWERQGVQTDDPLVLDTLMQIKE